jgi:hypothetical protein
MGLPDLAILLLAHEMGGPHVWAVTLWYLVLVVLCMRETERLAWGKSIASALAGSVAFGEFEFVFIR